MRDICNDEDHPFGGKTVVFGGDFHQTLPIVPGGSPEDVIYQSLLRSHLWRSMQVLTLCINMRLLNGSPSNASLSEERAFADWLLSVGRGDDIADDGTIQFDPRMR